MTRPPITPQVQPPPQPQVLHVQHQPSGGVVRGTINAAKFTFAIIFLLCVGTCVGTCVYCGSVVSSSSSTSNGR
jgi:hypothetical protein